MDKIRRCIKAEPEGWRHVDGLSASDAGELLDWLEVHGWEQHELRFEPEHGFIVRWRCGKANSP
jgi:hypothetical protein